MSIAARLQRLDEALAERELDALVVIDMIGLRYTTGFTGTNGIALLGPGIRRFATDFRYVEQAEEQVAPEIERSQTDREALLALPDVLPDRRPLRIGFDDARTTVREHARMLEVLPEGVELHPAPVLAALREVKAADELEGIRTAARIADEAFRAAVEPGLIGRTEREVAIALELEMRKRGAEAISFDPIVAAGPHGALPHAEPRDEPIPPDTLVVMDWGAQVDGWCSDCTRTIATGPISDEARAVYDLVLRAQEAALAEVRAGRDGAELDGIAREIITEAGYGERFGHGLGHGVGMEIHEGPRVSRRGSSVLRAGNVVTIEPGVYLPGELGVRIEDLVIVEEDGFEVISSLPKGLWTIDTVAS